jgi:hypothetical protein
MTRSRRAALALLACTLPLSAFAAERCAHEAPRSLPIDLDGVKTVVFDIGAQTLSVAPAGNGPASVSARACASSPSMLPQLQFTQARQGDKLVVTARRERSTPLWDSNDRYAHLIVNARLPADLMVQVRVGAGEAVVDGFRAVTADVGSGELTARNVRGRSTPMSVRARSKPRTSARCTWWPWVPANWPCARCTASRKSATSARANSRSAAPAGMSASMPSAVVPPASVRSAVRCA